MAGNIFDDALDQLPAAPAIAADPFAAAADHVVGQRLDAHKTALDRAADIAPDTAADVLTLSKRYNLPASVVERNLATFQKKAKSDDADPSALLTTPATADYLSDAYRAAAVGEEDRPALGVLEDTVRVMGRSVRAWAAGVNDFDAGVWGVAQQVGEAIGNDYLASLGYNARQESIANADFARGLQEGSSELTKAFYSGFESLGLMTPGALLTLVGGGSAAMMTATGVTAEGEAYGRARDAGKSVARSSLFGFTQAAVEVATEYIPVKFFLKDLATNAAFAKLVMHQLASEIPGEQIATLLQDADEWATFHPEKPFSDYLAERPDRAVQTLVSTITAVGAMSTVAGTLQQFAGDNGKAARAEESKSFFDTIAQTVAAMKSAEKHPASIETVIANATKDGGAEHLYAPIDTFTNYWQSVGEDPAAKAAELTGDPQAFERATRTGADLAIPTGVYAARIATTEHNAYFVNELRLAPDEMNIREAAAFKEQQTAIAQAQADAATAAESPAGAIIVQLRQQLEAAGVERGVANPIVELASSAFGNMAEIALDPAALLGSLGIAVERPAFGEPAAKTGPPASNEPRQARIQAGDGVPAVPVPAAATGPEAVAVPREPNIIPPATQETGITDEAGRALGGYAGEVERRGADAGAPGGLERRNEPIGLQPGFAPGDVGAAASRMRAENPNIAAEAEAMRARAAEVGRVKEPAGRAAQHGGVLDKKAAGEDTSEDVDAGTLIESNRGVDQARSPAENRVASSHPGNGKKADQRAAKHLDRVFGVILESARQLDPTVDEARLREEFDFRVDVYLDQQQLAADSGNDPHLILRTIAEYGGLSLGENAERASEIRQMFGGKTPAFGAVAGVRGVFRKAVRATSANQKSAGWPIDVMLQSLQGDNRFSWIENVDMLLDQIDEAMRQGADQIDAGVLPGTEELRDAGVRRERNWWADSWASQDLLEGDVDEGEIDLAQGDTSFNVREFNQSLFDEFESLKDPGDADTIATGEVQPRLPEAGQVREQEQATPEIAELPFSLTAPVAKSGKKNAGQTTLFQSEGVTDASIDAWAIDVMRRVGKDLKEFDVSLTTNGDLSLNRLIVARGAQRAGLGSKVMRELTRFADANGLRLELTPARQPEHGTTSRDRLVKFYKRFGFVENKGRHKDFRISAGMLREPSVSPMTEFDQALYHGSPHNFDRFSLEHIGTGEGAAAYGWGLYFAENPEVAVGYHRQLATDPTIELMKLGSMRLSMANSFDYSRRAGDNSLENIRASLAEDLLIDEVGMRAAVATGKIREHVLGVLADKIKGYKDESNDAEFIAAGERLYAELSKPGAIDVQLGGSEGGVYQVDIDDKHVANMLDWDAPASAQPEVVKKALEKLGFEWSPIRIRTPRQMAAWFKTLGAQRLFAEDVGIRESLREAMRFTEAAIAGDREAADSLMFWQQQHQGLFSKGMTDPTGETIYRELQMRATREGAKFEDAQRIASARLLEAGVPGLRYLDQDSRARGKGTRNVVVFDDKIITLTHKDGTAVTAEERREYFQGEGAGEQSMGAGKERRGAIRFGADRQFTISLLEKADLSTFLHESGHLFLEVFGDLADQLKAADVATLNARQAQAVADYDALLKWLGVEGRGQIGVEHHEKFARGFEAYLMEGRAPSPELRQAFAKFRAWLLGIYRSLKGLKVDLTDDVRRVMDRLVASEDAIARAEAENAIVPMFTTADDAGMAPAEFELYRKDVAQASQTARETLEVKMLAEVRREQEATWKAQRQDINDAVRVETYEMPVYQAITAMQRGTKPNGGPLVEGQVPVPLKLSRRMIVDRIGEDRLKRLPRPYIYTRDGGIDPDEAAAMLGYTSGDEMLKAIEGAEPMERRIERETDRRMLEQHGSMLLDDTLHEQAQAATANEHREAIVRAELSALAKKRRAVSPFVRQARQAVAEEKQTEIDQLTGQVRDLKATARGGAARINAALPPANVVREAAKLTVARMKVREIKPAVYWNAARRAGQKAIEAAARQDFDTAIASKQHELVSLAVFREATSVLEDVQKRVQQALDLSRPSAQKRLATAGDSYVDQVNTLLDRYDFARQSGKLLDRRESLRVWVDAMKAQDIPIDIPDDVIDDARRIHYSNLSVEELIGVTDALAHINHLAGLKDKLFKNQEQRAFEVVRDNMVASIREHNAENPLPVTFRRPDRVRRKIKDLFASHARLATLAQLMDGHEDGGAVWSAIVRPINEAATAKETRQAIEAKGFAEILEKHYPGRDKNRLHDKLHIPAIGNSLTLDERIAVARNWGNETSRDRMLNDPQRSWNQQQIQAILDTLDKNDLAYVQATFDYLERFWPEIAAKQKRVTGLEPEKVEALEIVTTAGTIAGGYFPLVADSRYNARTRQWEKLSEADLKRTGAYVSSTTKRGHIETRKKHARYTVKLEGGVVFTHIEQVVHDLTHHEMLLDVTKLLRDPKITAAFYGTVGDVVYEQFTSAIESIAAGRLEGAKNVIDEAAQFMKARTQVALLGWNLWTGLQQPLGLFNGADRVGAKWVAKGLFKWLTSPARMERTVKWIHETSPYMAGRAGSATQDLSDLKRVFSQPGGWFDTMVRTASRDVITQQRILNSMLWHIGLMQRVADVPTWLGQYEKSKAAGETDDRAVALADQAVIDAQGSGRISDLAKVQRGGPIAQLYMTFYSYGSTTFNATYRRAGRTNFRKPKHVAHMLGGLSLIYIFPAVGTVLLNHLVRGAGDEDDEPGDWLAEIAEESAASALNGIVLFRELALKGTRGYTGPAGARLLVMMNQLLDQAKQGELDDAAIAKGLEVGGVFAGLPTAQVQRMIEGWRAIRDDDAPISSLFFGAPRQ